MLPSLSLSPCPRLFNIAWTLYARVQQVGLQYDSTRVELGMLGDRGYWIISAGAKHVFYIGIKLGLLYFHCFRYNTETRFE